MKISYLADCASDKSCVTFHDQLELSKKELGDFERWCNQRVILGCIIRWYNKHEKIQSSAVARGGAGGARAPPPQFLS